MIGKPYMDPLGFHERMRKKVRPLCNWDNLWTKNAGLTNQPTNQLFSCTGYFPSHGSLSAQELMESVKVSDDEAEWSFAVICSSEPVGGDGRSSSLDVSSKHLFFCRCKKFIMCSRNPNWDPTFLCFFFVMFFADWKTHGRIINIFLNGHFRKVFLRFFASNQTQANPKSSLQEPRTSYEMRWNKSQKGKVISWVITPVTYLFGCPWKLITP